MAKRKLTKAEQIAQIPWDEISRTKGDKEGIKKLQGYLKTLRSGYSRRVASFNRKNLFSYAKDALEKTIPENWTAPKISSLNDRNKLLIEIARYIKFFNDETSSERGIKRVNRDQDERIFGTDAFGRPLHTMTSQERLDFWTLYEEFERQNPIWTTQPFSDDTQKALADAFFIDENFAKLSLAEKMEYLRKKLEEERSALNLEDSPNAYAGRGPNIT